MLLAIVATQSYKKYTRLQSSHIATYLNVLFTSHLNIFLTTY